jgi:hypothetical protein
MPIGQHVQFEPFENTDLVWPPKPRLLAIVAAFLSMVDTSIKEEISPGRRSTNLARTDRLPSG